ncbi:hypothetical protein LRS03_23785 [Rhizobacter sp. J219]|uniref:hypothetical protein n=1 Tax=Rhizobacter sp. J219 TaxID=2898430 RepID=UPI002151052A|nr:hypothetical protein [Rhizobacter sp. J219]MCR5885715.1 hypothetical protein [Rhizobacter sp. J219]
MSRIAIALPYAVSIRDFVHSGALDQLMKDPANELVIYTMNPAIPELADAKLRGVEIKAIAPYKDSLPERIFKACYPLFFAAQFVYIQQALAQRPLRRGLAAVCMALRRLLGTPATLRLGSWSLLAMYRLRRPTRQLDGNIKLLVGTRSLINSLDYGLMAEAAANGVPLMTVAGSWDNFTTKGYFPFPARQTVVWNLKMKQELMDLFKVPGGNIQIAGYPRAALLRNRVGDTNPQAYLQSIGIKGFRRYVLYSASYGELTRVPGHEMPVEYLAIKKICERLVPGLPADTCVLIRLHPFSKQEDRDFFSALERCFTYVPGRQDAYVERVMNDTDERHLAQQIAYSACVVSMASTMSIDTLCLRKPILNIAFEPIADMPFHEGIKRFYEFNHFRDLVKTARLPLATDVEQVIDFVDRCIEGRYASPVDYAAFQEWYVPDDSAEYPSKVCAAIESNVPKAAPSHDRPIGTARA